MMMTKFLLAWGLLLGGIYAPTSVWAREHVKAVPTRVSKIRSVVVLREALKQYPGRVIEMKRSQKNGTAYYKIKVLTEQGVLKELYFDVKNGKLFRVEDESHKTSKQPWGQILPLERFLDQLKLSDILAIELQSKHGRNVYMVKWLDNQGKLQDGRFDARTAQRLFKS